MFHNFDLAFIKDTPLATPGGRERAALQFRAEFFNLFKHRQFRFAAEYAARRGVRTHQQDGGIIPANPVLVEGDLLMGCPLSDVPDVGRKRGSATQRISFRFFARSLLDTNIRPQGIDVT
jgi:hypothetical protein